MTGRRARLAGVVLLAGATLGFGGCATAPSLPPASPSSPTTSVALPAGGVFLRDVWLDADFSFGRAPVGFSIPADVTPVGGANLQQMINVIFDPADGPKVHDYLMANLAAMGCRISASSTDSIVWDDGTWAGAFTMTDSQAGLTLRLHS